MISFLVSPGSSRDAKTRISRGGGRWGRRPSPGEGGGSRFRDEAQKRQTATAGGEEGSSRAKTTIGGSRFETRLKNDNQPRQGGRRAAAASPGEDGGSQFELRCRIDAGDWESNARPPPDLPPRNCEGNDDDDKSNDDHGYDKCDNYVDDGRVEEGYVGEEINVQRPLRRLVRY